MMQAPVASKTGASAAMPAASAAGTDPVTSNMEPVQRECWHIFNSPEANARDTGVGVDEVPFSVLADCQWPSCCLTCQNLKLVFCVCSKLSATSSEILCYAGDQPAQWQVFCAINQAGC